jgi:hypothetical protein
MRSKNGTKEAKVSLLKVKWYCEFERVNNEPYQGTFNEGEGSVQLTSLY